jgi:hypothetical protein
MKITVELTENELNEITTLTGINKKGPAIRQLVSDALATHRRAVMTAKYLHGDWSAKLSSYETSRKADRATTQTLAEQWRD